MESENPKINTQKPHVAKADVWGGLRVSIGKEFAGKYFFYWVSKEGEVIKVVITPVPETKTNLPKQT